MTIKVDWKYGQKYNDNNEFNPRLIACEICGDYYEPDYSHNCKEN